MVCATNQVFQIAELTIIFQHSTLTRKIYVFSHVIIYHIHSYADSRAKLHLQTQMEFCISIISIIVKDKA